MNIEEAIKILKQEPEFSLNYYNRENAIDVLLTAYEKQSKEIEELKEKNKTQPDCAEPIERTEEMVNMKWVNHNYINKDKIKAKIEFIKSLKEKFYYEENVISILQSLLEKE